MFVLTEPTRAQVVQHKLLQMERCEGARMVQRLGLIAELDDLDAARELGFRSTSHWLQAECRVDERTARDRVRVARRLREWPRMRAALEQGRLTYSQCRALSRASVDEDEAALIEVAVSSTVVALERHVRALRTAASADLETMEAARARRSLRYAWDDDGSLRVWGRLGPVEGAAIVEAVETGAAAIPAVDRVRASLDARRADALGAMARAGCPRTTLMLHADLDALTSPAGRRAGAILHFQGGPAIPSELARRLTCDAMVTVRGLNHGRTQRVVTPSQRRALEARDDRTCWMPGCDHTHDLDAHHIRHWSQGGRTDLANLILLCPYHHRLFHEGGWHMTRQRGRIIVRTLNGATVHDERAPRPPARPRRRSTPSAVSRRARLDRGSPRDIHIILSTKPRA